MRNINTEALVRVNDRTWYHINTKKELIHLLFGFRDGERIYDGKPVVIEIIEGSRAFRESLVLLANSFNKAIDHRWPKSHTVFLADHYDDPQQAKNAILENPYAIAE